MKSKFYETLEHSISQSQLSTYNTKIKTYIFRRIQGSLVKLYLLSIQKKVESKCHS